MRTLSCLCHVLLLQRQPERALAVCDVALALSDGGGAMAMLRLRRADALSLQGLLQGPEVLDCLAAVEQLEEEGKGCSHIKAAVCNNHGLVLVCQGRLAEAAVLLRQAAAALQQAGGDATSPAFNLCEPAKPACLPAS